MLFIDDRKGFSKISLIFWSIMFMIIWAVFVAEQLTIWGNAAVAVGGYSGIEAMFFENLNLVVGIVFAIFILAFSQMEGGAF